MKDDKYTNVKILFETIINKYNRKKKLERIILN